MEIIGIFLLVAPVLAALIPEAKKQGGFKALALNTIENIKNRQ